MPILIDRRYFLKSAVTGASLLAARMGAADPKPEVRWALLSDIHIAADAGDAYRGFHPHENLRKVLGQVQSQAFDAMMINGDLARLEGKPGDYDAVTGYLAPVTEKLPLAISLGNHDDRKNCRSAFASLAGEVQPVEKKFVLSVDAGPVQLVFLDSLLATNVTPGQLGKSQRDWLTGYLRSTAKPVVVCVHHDPDPNDDNGLVDAARFLQIVTSAKNVKAVLFGHTHAWHYDKQDGVHLINLPAVGYNFKDSEPVGWTEARFTSSGAVLKLNAIGGNLASNGQALNVSWR
jgi:3',5'-cyclic AMP phosphodiesterase CpdA